MMNDDRNNTQYSCGTVLNTVSNPTLADIVDENDWTILYVAGEYQYTLQYNYVIKYASQVIQPLPACQDHF